MSCAIRRDYVLCTIALALFALSFTATAQSGNYLPGELLIRFDDDADATTRQQILQQLGATEIGRYDFIQTSHFRIDNLSVEDALAQYAANPAIDIIEPNFIWSLDAVPDDSRFDELWGLENTGQTGGTPGADISATDAWEVSTGSRNVVVAVIDTGVDYNHPDLAANIYTNPGEIPGNGIDDDFNGFIDDVHGWDFVNGDNDPMDDHYHGTHCAGTIGAVGNNAIGVAGVNWEVSIMPIKFLDAGGFGSTAVAISCVQYTTMMGVDLTSNSWGGGPYSEALRMAISAAGDAGILFVAAAGNSGSDNDSFPHYPSSYDLPNVVAVAATNHNDALAGFSSYGLVSVDLAAPGVSILSTSPSNGYRYLDGTSMATPHVSGAIALMKAYAPALPMDLLLERLYDGVDPVPQLANFIRTGGRLNAFMALTEPDSIPPDPIGDLNVSLQGSNWLELAWTATGDDGSSGKATRYEVRYATFSFNEANYNSAQLFEVEQRPAEAGTPESLRVDGLDILTNYYVAVIARDEFGQESFSNVVNATTLGAPAIVSNPTSLSDALLTGGTNTQVVTLSNVGQGYLDYRLGAVEYLNAGDPQWLSAAPTNASIAAGQSAQLQVMLDATGLGGGSFNASLVLFTNDPTQLLVRIPVQLVVTPAPDVAADPAIFDFGNVYVGQSASTTVQLQNLGAATLNVAFLQLDPGDVSVLPAAPFAIPAGDALPLEISWQPLAAGPIQIDLRIHSDDPDTPAYLIQFSGEALDPPIIAVNPANTHVDLLTGELSTQSVVVQNDGGSDLQVATRVVAVDTGMAVDSRSSEEVAAFQQHQYSVARQPGDSSYGPPQLDAEPEAIVSSKVGPAVAGPSVLIIHAGNVAGVRTELEALGLFSVVDVYDASVGTPSLADMQAYDALVMSSNYSYANPTVVGNNLADYVDLGGAVVETTPVFVGGYDIGGRWASDQYSPFENGLPGGGSGSLGNHDAAHPIMDGITDIQGDLLARVSVRADAEWVADYDNGEPMVATKTDQVAAINAFLGSPGYYGGQVIEMLGNAILWTSGAATWLTVDPAEFTVAAGTSQLVELRFDATGLFGGDYAADVEFQSNDPVNPAAIHPATMHVTGAPDLVVVESQLDFGSPFVGGQVDLELHLENVGTDLVSISSIAADHPDYSADPTALDIPAGEAAIVTISFAPSSVALLPATLSVLSNDPLQPLMTVDLLGEGLEPPVLAYDPAFFYADLFTGESESQNLRISNLSGSDLVFSASVAAIPEAATFRLPQAPLVPIDYAEPYAVRVLDPVPNLPTDNRPDELGPVVDPKLIQYAAESAILVYADDYSRSAGSHWIDLALQELGLAYTAVYSSVSELELQLAASSWDLVIIDNVSNTMSNTVWDRLLLHVQNEGALIVSSWDADRGGSGPHILFQELGADWISDRFSTEPMFPWNPAHPIFNAVHSIGPLPTPTDSVNDNGDRFEAIGGAEAIAGFVASPTAGEACIIVSADYRAIVNGFLVAEHDTDSDLDGEIDAQALWVNQTVYALNSVGWLSLDPDGGVVPAGSYVDIAVQFDATGLFGGLYQANVLLESNDPLQASTELPVALNVTGAPDIDVDPLALDFGITYLATVGMDSVLVQNIGTDLLHVSSFGVDDSDYDVDPAGFDLAPGTSEWVVVRFAPTRLGPIDALLTIDSDDPDQPQWIVDLTGLGTEPPDIDISPTSVSVSVQAGDSAQEIVMVANTGGSRLDWEGSVIFAPATTTIEFGSPGVAVEGADGEAANSGLVRGTAGATLADLSGKKIMFERSHAQGSSVGWSRLIADLSARGAAFVENFDTLTPAVLADQDVLWIIDTSAPYDAAELAALANFMALGGGILLEGDNSSTVPVYNSIFATLNVPIVMSTFGGPGGTTNLVYEHPTTEDVTALFFASRLATLSSVAPPAVVVADVVAADHGIAAARIGSGRLMVVSDEIFFDSIIVSNDNELFGNQVFDWLSGGAFATVTPNQGSVEAGQGPAELVLNFESIGLNAGLYEALLVVDSNDPDESSIGIPLSMDVVGAPNLSVDPVSLSFGDQFLGSDTVMTLQAENVGTDALVVTAVASDVAQFSATPSDFVLLPGEGQSVDVHFVPDAIGVFAGALTFHSNDPDQPALPVPVDGSGVAAPVISVDPTSISVAMLSDEMRDETLTLQNLGGSPLIWEASILNARSSLAGVELQFNLADEPYTLFDGEVPVPGARASDRAMLANLSGKRILFDRSKGQTSSIGWSTIISDFVVRGAIFGENFGTITASVLEQQDVLWIIDLNTAYAPSERQAISDFVTSGGALLFEGDNAASIQIYNQLLADLGAQINVIYMGSASGSATTIYPHETTEGVSSIFISAMLSQISTVTAPAQRLVRFGPATDLAAASPVGYGRVIVVTDEIFSNVRMGIEDNQLFGNQVMDWLVGPAFVTVDPESGSLDPGVGPAAIDLHFDATGLLGGIYEADLLIQSNDPVQPTLTVPLLMDVMGVPQIVVEPASIDFGAVFLGATAEAHLTISNPGSDQLVVGSMLSSSPYFTPLADSLVVEIGESQILTVQFQPAAVQHYDATLTLYSNDPDLPEVVVNLAGDGLLPPRVEVTPDQVAIALGEGESGEAFVAIGNSGASTLQWTAQMRADRASGEEQPADLSGISILYDRSAGQPPSSSWSIYVAQLIAQGATVVENVAPLSAAVLAPHDIFWINDTPNPYDANQLAAIRDFVLLGKAILMQGDTNNSVTNYGSILAVLAADIVLSRNNGFDGETSDLTPHPTTSGVNSVWLSGNNATILSATGNAAMLVRDVGGIGAAAYAHAGAGRLMVLTDQLFDNAHIPQADNQLFGVQVMDWLAGSVFVWATPLSGSVAPGAPASELTLHFLAPLTGGVYEAELLLETNDPLDLQILVPVQLVVNLRDADETVVLPNRLIPGVGSDPFVGLVELPVDLDPADVVDESVRLQDTVPADPSATTIGDFNGNGRADLRFEFDRAASEALFVHDGDWSVKLSGVVSGTAAFAGEANVRVILPYLLGPPAAAQLTAGESFEVAWELPVAWPVASVALSYSTDGGQSWHAIASDLAPNTGYPWQIPAVETAQARLRVHYVDAAGIELGYDSSDADFAILSGATATDPGPTHFFLAVGDPNPFSRSTTIRFGLARETRVRLHVFDLRGRLVATLLDEDRLPGRHQVQWDGTDRASRRVASGVYFYRLLAGDFEATKRVTLTR